MLNKINDKQFKELILSSTSFWLNMLDDQANIAMWNTGAERISGYRADEVLGNQDIWELLYPDSAYRLNIFNRVLNIIDTGGELVDFETTITAKNGSKHDISWNTHSLKNEMGDTIGSIAIGRDITSINENSIQLESLASELKQSNIKLKKLSYIDALTNIPNRRAYSEKLKNELEAARCPDCELSLLMIDIDYFKQYNDIHGHEQGDITLTRVANQVKAMLPNQADFVARYGGEELVVILPCTSLVNGEILSKRILQSIIDLNIDHSYSPFNNALTISIGIASTKMSLKSLVKHADKALYVAKKKGRNRVESHITFSS